MHYIKPALEYAKQISLLESRGLAIPDQDVALLWLRTIGYYRLSAYFLPFKAPGQDQFKPDTSFAHVVRLYQFDANLRLLVMQAIDRIEIAVRAAVTYQFAHKLGPFGYADANNFRLHVASTSPGVAPTGLNHAEFMRMLDRDLAKSEEVFVRHYRAKYTLTPHPPIWMVTELSSFGTLARLHENSSKSVRKQVGKPFGASQSQITSWVNCLAYIRNVCAHHARLWNRETSIKPELTDEWKTEGVATNRLYCVLMMIEKMLLGSAPNDRWKDKLTMLIVDSPFVDLQAMEFPYDWLARSPWKESSL